MIFMAVRDFFSPEMKSMYARNMRYRITQNNHALRREYEKWLADGWVRPLSDEVSPPNTAKMAGTGTVSDKAASMWKRIKSWL